MTERTRKSPKLALGFQQEEIRDAVDTLEDRPRIPTKTPTSTADDGYAGQICKDSSYIYIYISGTGWKRTALSTF